MARKRTLDYVYNDTYLLLLRVIAKQTLSKLTFRPRPMLHSAWLAEPYISPQYTYFDWGNGSSPSATYRRYCSNYIGWQNND